MTPTARGSTASRPLSRRLVESDCGARLVSSRRFEVRGVRSRSSTAAPLHRLRGRRRHHRRDAAAAAQFEPLPPSRSLGDVPAEQALALAGAAPPAAQAAAARRADRGEPRVRSDVGIVSQRQRQRWRRRVVPPAARRRAAARAVGAARAPEPRRVRRRKQMSCLATEKNRPFSPSVFFTGPRNTKT